MLGAYAADPAVAPNIGREIAILSPADQLAVQNAGRAIQSGQPVPELWADYADRDQLESDLRGYFTDAEELAQIAEYLAQW